MVEEYYFKNPGDTAELYDIHDVLSFYDRRFFFGLLASTELKWSTRMTLCAGTCKSKGSNCLITLSVPLLKY